MIESWKKKAEREKEREMGGGGRERESRCKIHGEHLSRNIYESVAGNETDAEERGGRNGRERAARLE